MTIGKLWIVCVCMIGISLLDTQTKTYAQSPVKIKKQLRITPKVGNNYDLGIRLLPSEEEQEHGNAVPVLLRMVYEQERFMNDAYPKLRGFSEIDMNDPQWKDFNFNRFAEQIIRAGSMSYADWQYPLRSERPYEILIPDIQSQRILVGRGMTVWIRQQLSQGKTDKAIQGIEAQLACGRHCAATPFIVCHLVGFSIANMGFDNLELAIQSGDCPNMYWALATLPPTLQDLGSVVRWELWASPARLNEPLPAIGSNQWGPVANKFIDLYSEASSERYSREEGEALQNKIELLAKNELSMKFGFADDEVQRMTKEERIMRWIYLQYLQFRSQVEPLAFQSSKQIIATKIKIEAASKDLFAATGAKSSPFPVDLPQGMLACRIFERRAKFIQAIEAIRDYAGRNNGDLPAKLEDLHLQAPYDPFTEQPFIYSLTGNKAQLSQVSIDGIPGTVFDYELTVK